MRLLKNVLNRKLNEIKKRNCSAPFTLTVFLITSMLIIFSLESLGLLRKEKNLDYRIPTPEINIKLVNIENNKIQENSEFTENKYFKSLGPISGGSFDTKLSKLYQINSIIAQAAQDQLNFDLNYFDLEYEESFDQINDEEELLFFDV
jgi:hypothetical protein